MLIKLVKLLPLFTCLACNVENQNTFHIAFAGDMMLDRGVKESLKNSGTEYLLRNIAPELKKKEVVVVNFENPATYLQSGVSKKYVFKAHPRLIPGLRKSGITHLILANNHALDYKASGLLETLQIIKSSNLEYIGAGLNKSEACMPRIINLHKSSIAIYAVTTMVDSELFDDAQPTICNLSTSNLCIEIKELKKKHNMIVLVSIHWGQELYQQPSPNQVVDAHLLIDAGADAIIGHHPHVVQTIEFYHQKPILYSIGNFVFDSSHHGSNKGVLVDFTCYENQLMTSKILPVYINNSAPEIMKEPDSELFVKEIEDLSPGIELLKEKRYWIITSKT